MNQDVRDTIKQFYMDAQKIFKPRQIDIILYGSTIRGGFNAETSDIDFIVLVQGSLEPTDVSSIRTLHQSYRLSEDLIKLLEGRYLSIQNDVCQGGYYIGTNPKGWKYLPNHGFGPLESAMILDTWWSYNNESNISNLLSFTWEEVEHEINQQLHDFLHNELLGINTGYSEYAVKAACRSLYTYLHQGFLSKQDAIKWVDTNHFKLRELTEQEIIEKIDAILSKES